MGEGATRAPCPASSSSTPPMPMRKPTTTTSWRTDRTPNTLGRRHRHLRHLGRVQDLPPLREGEGDTKLCPIHPDRRAVQVVRRALRRVWSRRLRLLRRGRRYRRVPTSHGPHRGYGRPQEEPGTRCETPTGDRWRERRQKGRSAVGQAPSKGRPD